MATAVPVVGAPALAALALLLVSAQIWVLARKEPPAAAAH
jgi:hypothetical protein